MEEMVINNWKEEQIKTVKENFLKDGYIRPVGIIKGEKQSFMMAVESFPDEDAIFTFFTKIKNACHRHHAYAVMTATPAIFMNDNYSADGVVLTFETRFGNEVISYLVDKTHPDKLTKEIREKGIKSSFGELLPPLQS